MTTYIRETQESCFFFQMRDVEDLDPSDLTCFLPPAVAEAIEHVRVGGHRVFWELLELQLKELASLNVCFCLQDEDLEEPVPEVEEIRKRAACLILLFCDAI